jgi:KDO2-lipid IV(A) lauroyltransferase
VYHVFGYRRKVVRENLDLALPHLSVSEKKVIEKKFYKHMCDMFLEMIKTMSLTDKEIEERFIFKNLEIFEDLEKKGKSIAFMISHFASYEWVVSMNRHVNFKGFAIYKKLNNKYFDDLVKKIRSRFKATLVDSFHTKNVIEEHQKKGILGVYGFAADQSPMNRPKYHRMKFMGIEVPVYTGAETLSKEYDMNIIFLKVKKLKRGFYQGEFELLSDNVREIPDFQITEMYFKKVEEQIYEAPEFYLWTHKRWKHRTKS